MSDSGSNPGIENILLALFQFYHEHSLDRVKVIGLRDLLRFG